MSLQLTTEQLEAWVEKNGLLQPDYGQFAVFLRRCEQQEQAMIAKLHAALNAPDAPRTIFTGRHGLELAPF